MSPTLENHVRIPFLVHRLDIRSRGVVPEGLQVGGQTDLTVLLEVAAEGILSIESVCYPLNPPYLPVRPSSIQEKVQIVERQRTRVPARRPYE